MKAGSTKKRSAASVKAAAPLQHLDTPDDSPLEDDVVPEQLTTSVISACKVHRCRFLKYEPSTITALGFNTTGDMLAVARQNGDIELWNASLRQFHLHAVVSGRSTAVISSVVWTSAHRLFASSLDGTVSEVNLSTLRFVHSTHANGGPVWCMQYKASEQLVAVGCEDGRIRLYAVPEDDSEPLVFHKVLGGTGRRVVSLAIHGSSDYLFGGNDEGVIYKWNTRTGRNESRMTLERFAKQPPAVVWSLVVLADLTVISGDSNGNVHTWDGVSGTLMQTFAQLTADVLTLAVDTTETLLFASGIDNQVIQLRKGSTASSGKAGHQWAYAYSHRAHTHDVRALAISPSSDAALLVSGGVDTHLVWYNAAKFNALRPNKATPLPQRPFVSLAAQVRHVLVQHPTSLEVWKLASCAATSSSSPPPTMLAQLKLAGEANIVASAISPDGRFIACSTASVLKVFSVSGREIKKLPLAATVAHPAYSMVFTADSERLITGDVAVRLIDLTSLSVIKSLVKKNAVQTKSLAVSSDGQWLAVGDLNNHLSVFNLDTMSFYADFPTPQDMHTCMRFHPNGKILVVATVSNHFACYDVEQKNLTEWSRDNHHKLPKTLFLPQPYHIKGLAFHPTQPNSVVFWSQQFLFHIDIDQPIVRDDAKSKRRRTLSIGGTVDSSSDDVPDVPTGHPTYQFIDHYGPIAFADFFNASGATTPELVVVEMPFFKMLNALPDALHRPKYNGSGGGGH
ncbi:hypothetical protein DYB25_006995 [Aphanomyces astaci]|uniref:Uncharacterized protein n=1 Tax=Aphanomyces astaci TaxID=112090 RepID=A0A397BSG8_APHAT|nr:hypothetical protein DYB25_006995 [Aphanomyces astaci]RHY79854.1 hypothetical protein DYB30_005084 [Aphanomyces astaci]